MRYIVYRYKSLIYIIPEYDEKELEAAEELVKEYGGEFRQIGEFFASADVPSGRKWYGVQQNNSGKTPLISLLKCVARNADYL